MSDSANPLRGFKLKVPADLLGKQLRNQLGESAIDSLTRRMSDAKDITDSDAKPYSQRGPIYIPIVKGVKSQRFTGRTRSVGYNALKQSYTLTKGYVDSHTDGVSRSGHSLRFQDYQHFKTYIGHTGNRDLAVTGQMLASISITDNRPERIAIGIPNTRQQMKMSGNNAISPQWGWSPKNKEEIRQIFGQYLKENARAIVRKLF